MQVIAVFMELFLQGLAPDGQPLPFHAVLFELATQQLRLLLGLAAALLGIAQFTVGIFHVHARLAHFVVDGHAPLQQLFELQAQFFEGGLALLQVQAQLLAFLAQALGLQFQALKGLTGGIVLGSQRAQAHRQLMSMILVLTGFLTHPVEALAQAVALSQQQLTLFGVLGHDVEGVLQLQARLTQLFVLDSALLGQLGQFFIQAAAAQGQLFDLGLARR
ncbi:hypothetical protein D9M71_105790 [compost metagenome]